MIGERVLARRVDGSQLGRYRTLLEQRGMWLVLLLRLNPLTTSDLVSYAAGVAGVPAWKVALGTLFGLAPWCYAQAYFAEQVFEVVPGRYLVLGGVVLIIIAMGVLFTQRGRGASAEALRTKADSTGTAPGDTQEEESRARAPRTGRGQTRADTSHQLGPCHSAAEWMQNAAVHAQRRARHVDRRSRQMHACDMHRRSTVDVSSKKRWRRHRDMKRDRRGMGHWWMK